MSEKDYFFFFCNLQGVKGTDVQPILTEKPRNLSVVFIPRINELFYSEEFPNL